MWSFSPSGRPHRSCRECRQATALWVSLSTLPTPTLRPSQKEFGALGFISAGIHTFSLLTNAIFPFSCREPGVEFALAVQVIWDKLIFDWVQLNVLCSGGAISRHCHVSLGLCCLSCSTEIDPRACDWRVGSYQFTRSYLPWLHSLRTAVFSKIFFCCA